MRAYNKIKNMIIALLAAAFYCYSCMIVPDNNTTLIMLATIGIFCSVLMVMIEFDLMFGTRKQRNRRAKK